MPDVSLPLAHYSSPGQKSTWGKKSLHKSSWSEDAGRRNVNVSVIVTETDGLIWVKIVFNFFQGSYTSGMTSAILEARKKSLLTRYGKH